MQKIQGVAILESSGTTYFDSLTKSESESGKSSEELKITGGFELRKNEEPDRVSKMRVTNGVL